jgi:hypothetical protein
MVSFTATLTSSGLSFFFKLAEDWSVLPPSSSLSLMTVCFCSHLFSQIVASVVMYADNLLKGFATSFSVILSCVISSWLLETTGMNSSFILGAAVVVTSAFVYSLYPAVPTITLPPVPAHPQPIESIALLGNGTQSDTERLDIESRVPPPSSLLVADHR